MGFVEWAHTMRKKPIEARRRFSVLATVFVVACITLIWVVFFIRGVSEDLAESRQKAEIKNNTPMTFNEAASTLSLPEL